MILKFGMKHQEMKLYKVYINHDPWMTLTYFMARSRSPMHLNGKNVKLANGLIFYDLKKKLTLGVDLTLSWGYVHLYNHSSQTSLLACISGLR